MSLSFEEFPSASPADWEAQVARDLKGRDANSLAWTIDDGIRGKALFHSADTENIETRELYSGNSWKICAQVSTGAEAEHAISRGATALYIQGDVSGAWPDSIEVIRARSTEIASAGGATPAEEIASALKHPSAALLEFGIGSDYFVEIAKFRAARLLWPRVSSTPLRILARTTRRNQTIYDPYVNLLRATTEAMSAIIGGCDLLVVRPFDAAYQNPAEFSRRLAINTQLILREESHFNRMPDPAAGCWYLEWLTDTLARKAWELYESGASPAPLARKQVFIGVTKHADPNDRALDRLTIQPDEDRDPWIFEKERLAAERQERHSHE